MFGALRLGVWIDLVLLAGAAALLVRALRPRSARRSGDPSVVTR
jgi:hypothetical protein